MTRPLVSIVIPLYRVTPLIWNALSSLRQRTKYDNYEVIIINSPGSFAENCNRGIIASKGDYICLLNDDVIIHNEDWLDFLVNMMEEHPKAAAVSPKMIFQDGRIQFGGMIFHDNYHAGHLHWGFDYNDPRLIQNPRQFQATTFGCVLIRRDALVQMHNIRPHMVNDSCECPFINELYKIGGFEDVDWCLGAKLRGWEIWYEPRAEIIHMENQTFNAMDQQKRQETFQKSLELYLKQWAPKFKDGTFKVDDKDYPGGIV